MQNGLLVLSVGILLFFGCLFLYSILMIRFLSRCFKAAMERIEAQRPASDEPFFFQVGEDMPESIAFSDAVMEEGFYVSGDGASPGMIPACPPELDPEIGKIMDRFLAKKPISADYVDAFGHRELILSEPPPPGEG